MDSGLVEHLFKIIVVGDSGCGKTSLIHRYVQGVFSDKLRGTIGVDFALKLLHWDTETNVTLQLWDVAGQERYGHMTGVYYREAVGAMVVFDVTRPPTFEAVEKWKRDLDNKLGTDLPVVLLANKSDLPETFLHGREHQMDTFCITNRLLNWFKTSAKDGRNVDTAFKFLIHHVLAAAGSQGAARQRVGGFMLDEDEAHGTHKIT
eukprot:TRINITY_DN15203_c0_g1_i1.p1 TRINITY_DN15203_c0_g1~~TRINITY_DN15203_c0_g1_i1.p1  ORF type:complete len:220 (-),score=31.64 TRINITY_DN15203_c0_g1_i1:84-698(-)